MRFTPMSEKDAAAAASGLWQDGEYYFEVVDASEKQSSAGNDMFALEVMIIDESGNRKKIFDYLVQSEKAGWKTRHFAASCGLLPQYEDGEMSPNDIVGRAGKCQVGTQPAKDGYPAKNVIKGYLKASGVIFSLPVPERKPVPAGAGSDLDDSIPF